MREGADNANVELGAMLAVVVLLAVIRVVGAFGPDDGPTEAAAAPAVEETTAEALPPGADEPAPLPTDSIALAVADPEDPSPEALDPALPVTPEPGPDAPPEAEAPRPRTLAAPPPPPSTAVPTLAAPDEASVLADLAETIEEPVRTPPPASAAPPPASAPRPAPVPDRRPAEPEIFETVEQMPVLQGGLSGLQQRIRYPDLARRMGVEGRVYVQFIVNEDGSVANVRTVRGIGAGCDEAAEAAVRASRFSPGRQRGRLVKVRMTLPVTFRAN